MGKYYTVQIRASKCHYQVRINDAIIYIGSDGYNVDFELPINHLTFLGANAVGISILPLKNQTQLSELSIFKITVYEREHKEDRENRKDLSNYKAPDFHAKDSTPPTILLNQLQFENTDPHFKNIDWNNSLQKFNPDEIYSQVVSYYKFFHQLMVAKNMNEIMSNLKTKMQHYSTSMFINMDEFIELNRNFYDTMFSNKNIVAWPLEKQKLILLGNLDNKLFTLKNEIQESPLIFYDKKEKESHYIDFFIGKPKNENAFKIII